MRSSLTIAACLLCFALGLHLGSDASKPRLVGWGCTGTTGLLYADQESDFPLCLTIQEN